MAILRRSCADHGEVREAYLYREQRFDGPVPPEGVAEDTWLLKLLLAFPAGTDPPCSRDAIAAIMRPVEEAGRAGYRIPSFAVDVTHGDNEWLRTVARSGTKIV